MVAVHEQGYWMHEVSCYHGPLFLSQVLLFGFLFSQKPTSCTGQMEDIDTVDVVR